MKTPYVPLIFGEAVVRKLQKGRGWLTASVATSIAWPSFDVCVIYAGDEYFLHGTERDGKPSPPYITIAHEPYRADEELKKIHQFTSILSWFQGGYVHVYGHITSNRLYFQRSRTVVSPRITAGEESFNCNHMPIVEQENVRKALAFWREGKFLDEFHDSYAFLSYYKVIESQFSDGKKMSDWITSNIDKLTKRAAWRVAELRDQNIEVEVSKHLYKSGRCAVAHASLDGKIVDPDLQKDRRRLSADLVIIKELARMYIRDELKVPDSRTLYEIRDRLEPWSTFLSPNTLSLLKNGGTPDISDLSLTGRIVSIGLWLDGPILGLERMTMHADAVQNGVVRIVLFNERQTILLVFFLNYKSGRIHIDLLNGRLVYDNKPNKDDARAYATFFCIVSANGIVELTCEDKEPIDCEVVNPDYRGIRFHTDQFIADAIERYVENHTLGSQS